MSRPKEFLRRLGWSFKRTAHEAELAEEIQFHLQQSARDRAIDGESPEEAARRARRRLGNVTLLRESGRDAWTFAGVEGLFRDFAYGVRQLRRSPVFAAATILPLALGIGAVVTVFSLVDAVVLRKLPVQEPDRLVMFDEPSFSFPIFLEVNRRAESFSGFFGWSNERLTVGWGDRTEGVQGLLILGPYYETLGVSARIGRTLTSDDDSGNGARAAVISHACWQNRYGGDPDVLGRTIQVDGAAYTIVGVTPAGFFGVAPGINPEVTISAASLPMRHPGASDRLGPASSWLHMMARLKPGVGIEQANAELEIYWPQVTEATTTGEMPPELRQRYLDRKTALVSGDTGFSSVRVQFQESLWLLFGLVGLLLAVSCASVANLMLARMTKRRRELAVRTAIGAGRARILRQILTEGMLIAALGGLGGLAVCSFSATAVVKLLSTSDAPIYLELSPDWRVLSFALLISAFATLVCVLIPAVRSTKADPHAALKEARSVGPRRGDLSAAVVTAQVALSVVLLGGCALFLRSLNHVLSRDAGFDREPLIVATLDPVSAGYQGSQMSSWYDRVLERTGSLPSVESTSLSWAPPVSNESGNWSTRHTTIDGKEAETQVSVPTYLNLVSADYFSTVGMKLLAGRVFTALDQDSDARVTIINEALAQAYFGDEQPIGRRISLDKDEMYRDLEILGVVGNSSYQFLQEPTRRIAYLPLAKGSEMLEASNLALEVRARGPAASAVADVSEAIRAGDSAVPFRIETMEDRIAESLVREIALATLASVLGVLSLILAVAGVYGLLAYSVARRTNEVGVRIALGATRASVLRMVLRDAGRLTIAGLVAGVALFAAVARFASGLIHGVSPIDLGAIAVSSAVILCTALAAAYGPARQASRVSPVDAMRHE